MLSHFRLVKKIGEGGMGVVWRAEDIKLRRPVALKLLPSDLISDTPSRVRFLREARTAAAVNHPNIATIFEIDEDQGTIFIAMEFVEGKTLRDSMGNRPMPIEQALCTARELAEGLSAAHEAHVIHRDFKPENIMIATNGHAKILDFGLAKLVLEHRGESAIDLSNPTTVPHEMTRTGVTVGTPAYMSPEQARGQPLDPRTDVFSLGVVLYEMTTGERPFRGENWVELVDSILHHKPTRVRAINPKIPEDFSRIVEKCLQKEKENRHPTAREVLLELQQKAATGIGWSRRRKAAIIAGGVLLAVAISAGVYWQSRVQWARIEALPEVERLIDEAGIGGYSYFEAAFELAERAERYLGDDPSLRASFEKCSTALYPLEIETDPPGARIFVRNYSDPKDDWRYLGQTPLRADRLPFGMYRFRMEHPGYSTTDAIVLSGHGDDDHKLHRKLDPIEEIPAEMVRVAGGATEEIGELPDFFMDRLEVTNEQFKEFVSAGGYRNRSYWRQSFVEEGDTLSWEDAMPRFVDRTGRPGPATWEAGDYPDGDAAYPVSGVSWYEAAAYCEFAGKSLPSAYHWERAMGTGRGYVFGYFPALASLSNFDHEGAVPAGNRQGMTAFGALDMAGNVREWCWNATPKGRLIRGGAWDDYEYMTYELTQQSPWNRVAQNGFRCVVYAGHDDVPPAAFADLDLSPTYDFREAVPVNDAVFAAYKSRFDYDPPPLEAKIEEHDDSKRDWVREKITLSAAHGGQRIIAHLFLPRNASPPYQAVIYFPHGGVWGALPFEEYPHTNQLNFFVKGGRAAVYPIYSGSHERSDELGDEDWKPYNYANRVALWTKEFRRVVDYLESRSDIDSERIAFYGISLGGSMGGIIPAVEKRVRVNLLNLSGFGIERRPEVSAVNYLPRINVPTLMLNGRLDPSFPLETDLRTFFNLLGVPEEHKRLILYDTDHYIPHSEVTRECLAWLDRYFGPVN
jgi:pimeloyl-ACP methyl ester carboxylesterase